MNKQLRKIVLAAACFGALPFAASAAVLFQTGNIGTGTTDNVIFNACAGPITLDGTTVNGCMNTSHTTYVDFTGSESLHVNGGQARIEATDGIFDFLSIQMQDTGLGFTRIIFNINTDASNNAGTVDITANLFAPGSPASQTQSFNVANGSNFFTVSSDSGDVIKSLSFTSQIGITSVAFQDTRQVRLGVANAPGGDVCPPGTHGVPPNCITDQSDVPEPGSLALIGVALVAAGAARRRGKKA